jgi:glycosyltransferase involved in cell wall biosynthesis
MNVLMIWEKRPSLYGAMSQYAFNVLKHLSKRHAIRLIYIDTDPEYAAHPALESYCSQIDSVANKELSHSRQLLAVARNSLSAQKWLSEYRSFLTPAYSASMAETIRRALVEDKYDVIYTSGQVAFYAWRFNVPKVVYASDCRSAACYNEARMARRTETKVYWILAYLKNRWSEQKILDSFDDCIVVSNEEYDALKALRPGAHCSVVAHGVDAEFFAPSESSENWPSLAFVGDMSYSPNVIALEYFHSQIYKPLKKHFADLRLFVVGKNPIEEVRALANDPSITVTGFVEDVRPYVACASVVIAPFVSGTGVKTKVLEGMAMGKPVVTTSLGVRGINATRGEHLCVADNPAAFVNHVQELLEDEAKRKRMGHQAREFVMQHHSWPRVAEDIDHIFQTVQHR